MLVKDIKIKELLPYFETKKIKVKKISPSIYSLKCPVCKQEDYNANIHIHSNKLICRSCKGSYTVIDIISAMEFKEPASMNDCIKKLNTVLNLNLLTDEEKTHINTILDFYELNGFSLLPITIDSKDPPIEKAWTSKTHYNKTEWHTWIDRGLNIGVRTGEVSNLTILDIDTQEIPEEIKNIMGNPPIQKSTHGYHLLYKYNGKLPKTRINKYKLDLQNNGGYVVMSPSTIKGISRELEIKEIPLIPNELLDFLLKNINTNPLNLDTSNKDIVVDNSEVSVVEEGSRNSVLLKFGGMIRKNLNIKQVEEVLEIFNRYFCDPIYPQNEFKKIIDSLEKYTNFDDLELVQRILDYLKVVEEASRTEIANTVVGTSRGELKKKVDSALSYLAKEEYIKKKGNGFHILKKAKWETDLVENNLPIDFKMPYFNEVANFNWGDLILIGSKNKSGKCFAKGTGILMYDGSIKAVEQIQPKDQVMGIDSNPRTVLDTASGRDTMYEIVPCRGESFVVNSEHILSLKKVGTDEVVNISVNEFLRQNKTFQNHHYLYRVPIEFPEKEILLDPYFLGVWLGDGDKTNPRITTKDGEVIDFLYSYAKKVGQQVKIYEYGDKCPSYAITKGEAYVHKMLEKLNVKNNKHIPSEYKINSRAYRLQLLAGLIDSDGYLSEKKTAFEITICNKTLAEDIVYLSRSLGFFSYLKLRKTTIKSRGYVGQAYRISILGDVTEIPVKIKRKQPLKRTSNRNPLVTKFKVKKLVEDIYYGFTLDGDHLHLIDSFIVNHNTHISMNILEQLVQQGKRPYYISLEAGSRFKQIALTLGLKEGDFYHSFQVDPAKLELEPNAITIIDWLLVIDKSQTDLIFRHLVEQLHKTNGIIICFQQLKEDNGYFAPNMCKQFPSLSARYIYDDETDGEFGSFKIDVVREPKNKIKMYEVPCRYEWHTKKLIKIEDNVNEKITVS